MRIRNRARAGAILSVVLLLLGGCGPGETVELGPAQARVGTHPTRPGATSGQRFGNEMLPPAAGEESAPAPSRFRFELPEGWTDVGARSMRAVNLTAGAESQCYVIVLGGEAGGLVGNLNRWRGEVGLEPIVAEMAGAEIAAMPKIELLGNACPLLEVSGTYQGMGGSEGADRTVLGTLLIRSTGSVFVKMVGPSEEMREHRDAFVAFVESLEETP